MRFQQTSGAVMAKGIEDTAMYRDVRLLALNEVGGDPDRFGISVDEFHRTNELRFGSWPRALLAATTHDTKRSADVRARIAVLATMADGWLELVDWWRARCDESTTTAGALDADEQLFVLQTLVGAWPLSRARLDGYLVKAFREAKRHTAWVDPDEAWERAVSEVVAQAMADPRFADVFIPFVVDVVHRADRISLGALVLRTTAPGIPDVYQGDELWNHLLVDPDNRRPVDWSLRQLLLEHQLPRHAGGSVHGQALHLACAARPARPRLGIRRARVCAARCTRRCVRVRPRLARRARRRGRRPGATGSHARAPVRRRRPGGGRPARAPRRGVRRPPTRRVRHVRHRGRAPALTPRVCRSRSTTRGTTHGPEPGPARHAGTQARRHAGREHRMPRAWSAKRERQYEHIKEGLHEHGEGEDTAEEIAARTVNKERARSGEARESSRTSTEDISSGRRGGLRSHRGAGGRTRDQLYNEAREKNVAGRSKMNKAELERAVGR